MIPIFPSLCIAYLTLLLLAGKQKGIKDSPNRGPLEDLKNLNGELIRTTKFTDKIQDIIQFVPSMIRPI